MSIKYKHSNQYSLYFCTFTCYQWLPLIEHTNGYDIVYNWFDVLKDDAVDIIAYVVMPNHVHCILYFPDENYELEKIIGNGKRFMAYEIINRLEAMEDSATLQRLQESLTARDRNKGQLHKVFENSFDAKAIFSDKFLIQKIDYIHQNPVSGKWKLAENFTLYEHSSASYYEEGLAKHFTPRHYNDV
ncbi:MAG: hypothetical protein ABIT96_10910 [Ferruginibacter sp.]